jgi:hypothetical protein
MKIAPNEKFACFVLTRCWMQDGVPEELQLGPAMWASRTPDLKMAEHWPKWLGSITMDELNEASLAIYTTMPSEQPKILDGENQELLTRLNYVLYGLILQGVPVYLKGFSFNGANVDGDVQVRQFSELKPYQPTYELPELRPGVDELQTAVAFAARLREVNEGKANWQRLRRGLKVLFEGSTISDGGERLHHFVRALEALLKPEIGNTKNQFAHRIDQTFTAANAETRETLLQIFDLRSHVEHMHPVLDALVGDDAMRIATANRRTRQVDVLARLALRRVLGSDALLNSFKTEAGVDGFWALPDAARVAAWGNRLDLRTVA